MSRDYWASTGLPQIDPILILGLGFLGEDPTVHSSGISYGLPGPGSIGVVQK